jgi:hypothetical protein
MAAMVALGVALRFFQEGRRRLGRSSRPCGRHNNKEQGNGPLSSLYFSNTFSTWPTFFWTFPAIFSS